jgi:holo-[acyl-carrier protein] synthase
VIIGVGFDLIDIERIESILRDKDSLFLPRLLTVKETEQLSQYSGLHRRAEWVAGRFAAKEALFKALGTGVGGSQGMRDVEVLANSAGRPILTVSPLIEKQFKQSVAFQISITHTKMTAGAVVVIESNDHEKGDREDD